MATKTEYLVINLSTAEVQPFFKSREQAEKFIKEINIPEITQKELDESIDLGKVQRTLIMPCQETEVPTDVENIEEVFNLEKHPELILYDNADSTSSFSKVAEYFEDTLNEDFISTQDIPVTYVLG